MNRWGSPAVASATLGRVRSSIRALPGALLVAALLLASPAKADEWSGASELSSPASRDAAQLVIDANTIGDFAAAWKQSSDADIATVLQALGGSPGAPQEYAGDYDDPDVAIGGNSVGLLAFEDGSGSTSVHAASKASGASSFTSLMSFTGDGHGSPSAPASAAQPSVAVNGLGTGMLMFARDYYYPPSYSGIAEAIEGRILTNAATNTWDAGTDLNADVYDPRGTEVSVGPDGSAFLGINHFNVGPCWGLDTAVLENNGTGSTDPDSFAYKCAGNQYNGVYPSNDRLPNNDIVMAYPHHDDGSVNFLDLPKARANTGTSNLEASEVRLDDPGGTQTTSGGVRVRTDAAGNAVVVWYDSDSGVGNPESMLARRRPSGGSWGPVEVISSGEDYSGDLDFDMDDAGNGYLVYKRTNPGSGDQEIVAAERPPGAGGGWTTPELLSEGQGSVDEPRVAAARNGGAFAAWIANGNDGVFYAHDSAPQCGDGVDNDGDGKIDFPADPGCSSATDDNETDPPACSDGIDNDGDGKIDFPADPGCSSAADTDETDEDKGDSAACKSAKTQLSKAKTAKKKAAKKAKKAKKAVKKASGKKKKKAKKKLKKANKKLKKTKKKLKKAKKKKKAKC